MAQHRFSYDLEQRIQELDKLLEEQRLKSQKALERAQAALQHSQAARRHYSDHLRKIGKSPSHATPVWTEATTELLLVTDRAPRE